MKYISRQEFEALGEPIGECVTQPKLGGGYFCGGGGGGPTSSTVTQSNIPDWLRPQVEGMLGAGISSLYGTGQTGVDENGNPIYNIGDPKPFTPFSQQGEDYVAGFTPGQQQAMNLANWLSSSEGGQNLINEQYGRAADFAARSGWGAQSAADAAKEYGGAGYRSGLLGQELGQAGGKYFGELGAGYGKLGQEIAAKGGEYYGGLGAQYGNQAADLAPVAQQYGRLGIDYGKLGQEMAAERGAQYGDIGAGYGAEAAALSPIAQQYGKQAADIGRMGLRAEELGRDITGQARDYAGQAAGIGGLYERMATSPEDYQRFMSPYQKLVTEQQQQGALRQKQIADQTRKAAAVRAGAFGGSRQAIEQAEAERALQSQLQGIEAQGLQSAYQQAQGNILNRAQLEAQGLQGAQQGLGTALQGGQLGLSGIGQAMAGQQAGLQGLGQAGQMYGLGMQGAGMGLQGLDRILAGTAQGMQGAGMGLQGLGQAGQMYGLGMQGAGMGLQGVQQQLAGTAQGMQGAGMGLQGIQQQLAGTAQGMQGAGMGLQGTQAGLGAYGLMGQAGGQLANITGQRLKDVMGTAQFGFGMGEQQRQLLQQAINQEIQNFAMAQEMPYQRATQLNALLRGYAMPGQTTNQYQAAAPIASQLAGAGLGIAGLSGMMGRKAGGTVKAEGDGVDRLALRNALAGA